MSFVKRTYVDQQTVITADNLNDIQDELLRLGVSEESLWNSVTSAGTKASNALDNEAAAYNYHLQYHVGDYCLYQQKLYRCTVETPAAGETWNSSHWTAVTVGDEMIETASELSELRNTLNHKADSIYDTASGDIASFPDGADGLPVKDLTVNIEPVQDLHGQASPYPAGGGGKNLIPMTVARLKEINTRGSWSGNTYTNGGTAFTVLTDDGGNVTGIRVAGAFTTSVTPIFSVARDLGISSGDYILSGAPSGGGLDKWRMFAENSGGTVVDRDYGSGVSISGDVSSINIRLDSATNVDITFKPMLRLSSVSDATFAPYANICPISGWTGANVTRTGKNLLSGLVQGGLSTQGVLVPSVTNRVSSADFIPVKPGETYTISGSTNISGRQAKAYVLEFATSGGSGSVKTESWTGLPMTFTAVSSAKYIKIMVGLTYDTDLTPSDIQNAQIEVGSTATSFEPFKAIDVYPITFPSGTTVYGGTLDVTTGTLTVDRAMVDLGDIVWQKLADFNTIYYNSFIHDFKQYGDGNIKYANIISDSYKVVEKESSSVGNCEISMYHKVSQNWDRLFVRDDTIGDITASEFKAAVAGRKIVYVLAQPTSVTLTATEVLTLLGQNNVWTDCGPVSVEYPADTKLYIQKINAPTDDDMIADANIASGQYFIVNNNLYLSTSAILAGDPIKPGTNCTLTNLAAALNALNS